MSRNSRPRGGSGTEDRWMVLAQRGGSKRSKPLWYKPAATKLILVDGANLPLLSAVQPSQLSQSSQSSQSRQ